MPTPFPLDTLTVDPEFAGLIPDPPANSYELLEQRLIKEGYNPAEKLEVWDGHDVVVDGHTRLGICKKHGIPVPREAVARLAFPDREAVKEYMLEKQLARRNLNPIQYKVLLAQLYKMERGRPGVAAGGPADEKVAKKAGVSARTVRRAAKFVEAVDKLDAETKKAVLAGKVKAKAVVAPPPVKAKKKQGAARFAWGETARDLGRMVRVPDRIREAFPDNKLGDELDAMLQLAREFVEHYEKCRKKLAK